MNALNALWSDDSSESNDDETDTESDQEKSNLALMAFVEVEENSVDIDSIIASKNITDPTTLEILESIAISKGLKRGIKKVEEKIKVEASTSTKVEEVY